jgi:CubicO group peptidase (beta-lactamase class C family)
MILNLIAAGVLSLLSLAGAAASAVGQEQPTVESVRRKPWYTWNQADLVFGFSHIDQVYPARKIPRGERDRELPMGPPISRLAKGTPAGDSLETFIVEQKVAGMIVLRDGRIRLERYALGYGPTGRWVSQSVAKSITSTLVGAAIKDGFIASLDDPVTKYVAGLRGSVYDGVTVRQLLTMASGVRWTEDYTDPKSDIVRFYLAPVDSGYDATVSYMRRLTREVPPGAKWVYKTGETHLIGVLVRSATLQPLAQYLSDKIWAPYGMEQAASWGIDRSGQELAGCCLQASLRDFARYGQLVLDNGVIDGRSIVPDGWFEDATASHVATSYPDRGYGYQWWPAPDGTVNAFGIHGQLIHLDRVRRLVVAINSAWPEATSPTRSAARTRMLATIASALDREAP